MAVKISEYARRQLERLNSDGLQNLAEAFDRAVALHGDRAAYICKGQETSFAEVESASRALAAWLRGPAGLEAGDRIAIQLPNITQYPIAAWAAIRAGLIIVNTNPLYTARELLHQFNDSGAKALIVLADLLPVVSEVLPQTAIDCVISTSAADLLQPQEMQPGAADNLHSLPAILQQGASLDLPACSSSLDDIAVLQYTSGTTGLAKGAMLTQGNLIANSRMGDETFGSNPAEIDTAIAPMPLYHIYGFAVNVVSGLLRGSLSVLIPNARDTDDLIDTMTKHRFNVFTGINTLFASMLQHPDFDSIDFTYVNKVISGGTTLVEEIALEWEERTGSVIYEGYGLSESAAGGSVNTPAGRQLGSVGKPLAYSEVRLVDESGEVLGPVGRGELQIRGPHVMAGYWNQPEATAEVLDDDGWFSTGDVAVIQDDGFIRIVDRIKDMIIVSGFNVYPTEIETVVYGLDGVAECAVVGVPDERSGEAVKLFVACAGAGVTEDQLREHCRKQLAAYKVPKLIEFRPELPKSIVGKILRRELRDKCTE